MRTRLTLLNRFPLSIDLETVEREIGKIDGVKMEHIPAIIRQFGDLLVEEGTSNGSTDNSAKPPLPLSETGTLPNGNGHAPASERMDVDTSAGSTNSEKVKVSDLSDADRAKLEFLAEVQNTFHSTEAVGLAQGFMKNQLTFYEAATQLPSAFLKHPHMIARFAVLTDIPTQQNQLRSLAAATSRLLSHINSIPLSLRRQACCEVAELVVKHKLPKRASQTREFVYYACKPVVPRYVAVPRVTQLPELIMDDDDEPVVARPSVSPRMPPKSDESTLGASIEAFKPTPLSPSTSSFTIQSHGPSYTQRPATYEPPTCTMRDALGDSVLNDFFHCAGSGSEGSSQDNINNPHQDALFRLEEDALCLDVQIGRAHPFASSKKSAKD